MSNEPWEFVEPEPTVPPLRVIVIPSLGSKNFPKTEIVPDAMFKNGMAFYQLKYCSDAKVYFQELLRRYSRKDAIMVVGHNPTMTEFLNKLVGAPSSALELKKGSIARVEKEGRRAAVLKWCMPPKVVRSIQQAAASSSRPKTVSK